MVTENQIATAISKLNANAKAIDAAGRREGEARSKAKMAEKNMYKAISRRSELILKDALYRKELISKGIYKYLGSKAEAESPEFVNHVIKIHREVISDMKGKF